MSKPTGTVFVAYPSKPVGIGNIIESSVRMNNGKVGGIAIKTWRQRDVAGRFIAEDIMTAIDTAPFVVADITRLNFNVTFEVGYAIGRGKPVMLSVHRGLDPETKRLEKLGIFDSIGWSMYETATEFRSSIEDKDQHVALRPPLEKPNKAAPIYVVDTKQKTDYSVRLMASLEKAKIRHRNFDPEEQPRMSALDTIRQVSTSAAVIVQLLPKESHDYENNNLRAAFVAGLAYGMERQLLMLQIGYDPIPLDYRDLVSVIKHPRDIDDAVAEIAPRVMDSLHEEWSNPLPKPTGRLYDLDLGASAAENEVNSLPAYYLPTAQFEDALKGRVRLAVGRKGSGKSALFYRVRDRLRGHKRNLVLDLKPDGHQLKRFKDIVFSFLGDAVQEHVAWAFWEYVLLLELCHNILERDKTAHLRDHRVYQAYVDLQSLYQTEEYVSEGDFSERIRALINRINADPRWTRAKNEGLSANAVRELLYAHDIPKLRTHLGSYLPAAGHLWVLFDNIDKSWPTRGVTRSDIVILRGLLEATRKLERQLGKHGLEVHSIVFLRNDVYELLVEESPDRGKESKTTLDWTDPDLLTELLRRRIAFGLDSQNATMQELWGEIAVSHVDGEASLQYLLDRSLMRPRNLINIVTYSRNIATNLGHKRIQSDDMIKACAQYSSDVATEIGLEVRDVYPEAEDVLYLFIGMSNVLTLKELYETFSTGGINPDDYVTLAEILLWFGFLGVSTCSGTENVVFAYDVFYDMKKLKQLGSGFRDMSQQLVIHKAFWPFLDIDTTETS